MGSSSAEHSPVKIAGEVLRSLREATGLTQAEIAERAYCSQSLISGLERGTKTTSKKTIGLIDNAVGANGLIIKIWPVTESGWQSPESLADIEAKASVINDWDERLVPGLLQTPDYARAVMLAGLPRASDEEIADAVKTRMDRQSVFAKSNPPLGWFVLGQAVLYRPFGGREIMRDQLIRVEEAASQPNFTIQVMRLNSVEHPGSKGPLRIMEFSDNSPIWYTEGSSSGRMTEAKGEVASAMADFNLIRASACHPASRSSSSGRYGKHGMSDLTWVKSSYSGAGQANCVEIAALPDGSRAVRDSKDPDGEILVLTPGQWAALRGSL